MTASAPRPRACSTTTTRVTGRCVTSLLVSRSGCGVEGAGGVGKQLAQRLVADGETVLDVPAKLSSRVRAMSTGHGRKTDPTDARAVAIVGLRNPDLTHVRADGETVALRLLSERRRDLVRSRTQAVNRLH
jgi:transposase